MPSSSSRAAGAAAQRRGAGQDRARSRALACPRSSDVQHAGGRCFEDNQAAANRNAAPAGRAQGACARLRQHALLARSAQRAADHRVDPHCACDAAACREGNLRGEPAMRSLRASMPRISEWEIGAEALPRHQGRRRARQLGLFRRAVRIADRRRGGAPSGHSAVARRARGALQAHAGSRRARPYCRSARESGAWCGRLRRRAEQRP